MRLNNKTGTPDSWEIPNMKAEHTLILNSNGVIQPFKSGSYHHKPPLLSLIVEKDISDVLDT